MGSDFRSASVSFVAPIDRGMGCVQPCHVHLKGASVSAVLVVALSSIEFRAQMPFSCLLHCAAR